MWERKTIPVNVLFAPKLKGGGIVHYCQPPPSPQTTSDDVRTMAIALAVWLVVVVAVYTGLCQSVSDEAANVTVTVCLASASPVPIEFASIAVDFLPFVLPWPLPGWKARKRFLWRLLQCFGCIVGFPALSCEVGFMHVLITDALTSSCTYDHYPTIISVNRQDHDV